MANTLTGDVKMKNFIESHKQDLYKTLEELFCCRTRFCTARAGWLNLVVVSTALALPCPKGSIISDFCCLACSRT